MLHARVCIPFFAFMKENYHFRESLKYVPTQNSWQIINFIKNYLTFTKVPDEYLKHLLPLLFHIKESSFLQQVQELNGVI